MYIGKKELLLIEKQRKLEEKYSAQIEEIFGGDQLSNLTENDYNFRKNIVKSIVADLSGTHPEKIVYVESPNNYDDIFALGDERLVNFIGYAIESQMNRIGVEGLTPDIEYLIEVLEENNIPVPDYFRDGGFVIIALDIRSLSERRKSMRTSPFLNYRNLFWVMVHEVFHNYPEPTGDERKTEINTYNWMYEHNYTDPIGLKLYLDILGNTNSEYNIADYIIEDLKKRDVELLLSYLFVYEDFITEILEERLDFELNFEVWEEGNPDYERNALADAIYTDSREEEMYAVLDYIKKQIDEIVL